mmetsp:Transcript_25428/g.22589  ORF Transcript_25428/g.22589 Transcript_25428/m.22589 type:complete len:122 (+) Transcript_25428:853-1218(+)
MCQVMIGIHIGVFISMIFFNSWQWFLCLKGTPQIEFLQNLEDPSSIKKHGFSSKMDNLYLTFGTKNLLKILLPSLRSQPLEGLEWTLEKIENNRKVQESALRYINQVEDDTEIRNLEIDLA